MPSDVPTIITKDFITPHWMQERTVKLDKHIKEYVRDIDRPEPIKVSNESFKLD